MKRLSWFLAAFFGLVFLGATLLNAELVGKSRAALAGGALRDLSRIPLSRWHLLVIVPDTDDSFFSGLLDGIAEEAPLADAAVQVVLYPGSSPADAERWFDIALRSGVDGLIMYAARSEPLEDRTAAAAAAGLVFVPVGKDAPPGLLSCFIGSASLFQGYEGGKILVSRLGSSARLGVILPTSGATRPEDDSLYRGVAASVATVRGAAITAVAWSKPGFLSGEEAAASLLRAHPGINAIFCANSRDTLGAAQVVVDQNLVGRVLIVGADETPELVRYLDKGVVTASIVRDSRRIGAEAVRAFTGMKAGRPPPGTLEMGFTVRGPGELP